MLVGQHSAEILEQDSFENIVEYLKDDLPEKVKIEAEDIITRALDMDIKHQLNLFEVEYQLLHEEMIDIRHNKEKYEKQEMTNQNLVKEVENLKGRLQEANERIRGLESALLKVQLENEMLKSQLSKTNSHCLGSNAARCDRDLLASEGANLTEQAGSGRSASVPSALLSPTSSEVENIMNCVNNKRDCEDGGRGSDEKSWELVPSPSTVNREMDSVLQRIQSLDSDSDPSRTDTDSDLCGSADSTNACNDKKNEQVKEKRLSVTKKRPALPNLTTTILPLESPWIAPSLVWVHTVEDKPVL